MKRRILFAALALSVVFFSGCSDKNQTESISSSKINVSVFSAKKGDISSTVSYAGTLDATEQVSVSARVSARAVDVLVKEGDYVEEGDVIINLDPTDIRLSYEQALAAYESAKAGYNSVMNSSSKQQTTQANQALANAKNAYAQAKSNLEREKVLFENASQVKIARQGFEDAKGAYDRTLQLFNMGGASRIELEAAYSKMLSAEENLKTVEATSSASYEAAQIAFSNAENALKSAEENVNLTANAVASSKETARASVGQAKAALDIAQNSWSNTSVTAPISGYVSKIYVSRGQMVAAASPAFEISNTNMIDAKIQVSESVIGLIEQGAPASITVSSLKEEPIEGKVTVVNPVKDAQTGLYSIEVAIDNSDDAIKAGMLADITLTTSSKSGVIKVPSEALINESGEYFVYIAKGDIAKRCKVTIGINDGVYTEIIHGVKSGDDVIVEGKEYVSEVNNEITITGEYKPE